MDGVEGSKGWEGPRRSKGMLLAALVLLSALGGQALASNDNICQTHMNSTKLIPYDTVYLGTNSLTVHVKMEAAGCINDTQLLDMTQFQVTNKTFLNRKWYEFFFLNCGNYIAKIGTEIVKFRHEAQCLAKGANSKTILSVGSDVLLGRKCKGPVIRVKLEEQGKAECKRLEEGGMPDTDHSLTIQPDRSSYQDLLDFLDNRKHDRSDMFFGGLPDPVEPAEDTIDEQNIFNNAGLLFGNRQDPKEPEVDQSETFLKWPKINYDDILQATSATPTYNLDDDMYLDNHTSFNKHRNYKENAIPIFIGIVAFTVSMCLRFCMCRGKSVVQRVTTVTVIRSRPVDATDAPQDQQDPPPSYVDVVNEVTSPGSAAGEGSVEPPPPAYADIVNEVQPPTYSEVEAQSMPASEEILLADQSAEAQTTQPSTDAESVPEAKGLAPNKNLISKYRSQQKQFAFKMLEED